MCSSVSTGSVILRLKHSSDHCTPGGRARGRGCRGEPGDGAAGESPGTGLQGRARGRGCRGGPGDKAAVWCMVYCNVWLIGTCGYCNCGKKLCASYPGVHLLDTHYKAMLG